MGVTVTPSSSEGSVAETLQQSEIALYEAKRNGRNRVEVFSAANFALSVSNSGDRSKLVLADRSFQD
jgi:predicted signal transduction protein with EAL and GGDEF domain